MQLQTFRLATLSKSDSNTNVFLCNCVTILKQASKIVCHNNKLFFIVLLEWNDSVSVLRFESLKINYLG